MCVKAEGQPHMVVSLRKTNQGEDADRGKCMLSPGASGPFQQLT